MKNIQLRGQEMTILTYQIFETVVREKSFQKASEVLHMTPSAVSHAISAMEKEIGAALFVRGKQETVLTPYGNLFFRMSGRCSKARKICVRWWRIFRDWKRGR